VLNPYLQGNFAPVWEERTETHDLEVTGAIPPELDGRLLRNGPNPPKLPMNDEDYHWFSGAGMIHAITLKAGRATGYRNRWVRTRALAALLDTPVPKGPNEPIHGPANTHVIHHNGHTMALVESGLPHVLSPELDRARTFDFDGGLGSPMTAHPKVDPATGELVFFGYDTLGPPFLRYHVVEASGALVHSEPVTLPRAVMMHDFAVTDSRVVFMDLPVIFDLNLALQGRPLPFHWDAEGGARLGVMPRRGRDAEVVWIDMDPNYVFHVMNAFDDGHQIVMDVLRYDRAFDTAPGEAIATGLPALTRWRVDPVARRVLEAPLDDTPVEFPRIADTHAGRPYRYGYATILGQNPEEPSFPGLVQYDLERDRSVRFDPGEHRSVSEPVFVPSAEGRNEDEGWVLAVVYDATTHLSDLVILDATSFAGPPVATVHLGARIPFGFHGSWVPRGTR
jgi:carotenoid cleavage dioxygenase